MYIYIYIYISAQVSVYLLSLLDEIKHLLSSMIYVNLEIVYHLCVTKHSPRFESICSVMR